MEYCYVGSVKPHVCLIGISFWISILVESYKLIRASYCSLTYDLIFWFSVFLFFLKFMVMVFIFLKETQVPKIKSKILKTIFFNSKLDLDFFTTYLERRLESKQTPRR